LPWTQDETRDYQNIPNVPRHMWNKSNEGFNISMENISQFCRLPEGFTLNAKGHLTWFYVVGLMVETGW